MDKHQDNTAEVMAMTSAGNHNSWVASWLVKSRAECLQLISELDLSGRSSWSSHTQAIPKAG